MNVFSQPLLRIAESTAEALGTLVEGSENGASLSGERGSKGLGSSVREALHNNMSSPPSLGDRPLRQRREPLLGGRECIRDALEEATQASEIYSARHNRRPDVRSAGSRATAGVLEHAPSIFCPASRGSNAARSRSACARTKPSSQMAMIWRIRGKCQYPWRLAQHGQEKHNT